MIVLCSTVGRGYSLFSENGRYAILSLCFHRTQNARCWNSKLTNAEMRRYKYLDISETNASRIDCSQCFRVSTCQCSFIRALPKIMEQRNATRTPQPMNPTTEDTLTLGMMARYGRDVSASISHRIKPTTWVHWAVYNLPSNDTWESFLGWIVTAKVMR